MRLFQVPPQDFDPEILREPAEILRGGGVVGFPTETVYGLGAIASDPRAVDRLVRLKGRPDDKPFSYHVASVGQILDLVGELPPAARILLDRYAPGPITLVVPPRPDGGGSGGEGPAGRGLAGGRPGSEKEGIGVRVPANEIARKLIELAGAPLYVPSANPAGEPPALSADDVIRYYGEGLDAVVDGGVVQIKQSSTVVRVDERGYEVLREGIITKEMVHQILSGRRVLFVCTGNTCRSPMAAELFRKHLAARLGRAMDELNELGYRIGSAGTFAVRGNRPTEHAVTVMREMGCDISYHVSQPVTVDLLSQVDRVYALNRSHHQIVARMAEELDAAVRPQVDMLVTDGIVDPVGGDIETYRLCAVEIERALERILPR